jgi:hypothetical protein
LLASLVKGSSGDTSSVAEFLDAALNWFGNPDSRLGTAREKGEKLAKLVVNRRTLLVLAQEFFDPSGRQPNKTTAPLDSIIASSRFKVAARSDQLMFPSNGIDVFF